MAKVLYITAHPFNELVSNSMAAGKAFIETYQQQHPDDEVKHIDLFERKGSISNFRVMLECSNVEVVIRNASRLCKI
ncbi:hypothetical protein APV52_05990 [Staphylococcus aureus]|nr:hypothetical protein APV52_05990 [Staphylococcus aureus]